MNKYQKLYEDLIDFRKNILPLCSYGRLPAKSKELNLPPFYGEYHHIKMVKLFPEKENDPENIICLTTYEHILAHKYLALWYKKEYGRSSELYRKAHSAYFFMTISRDKNKMIDEDAAKARFEEGRLRSLRTKGKPLAKKNRDSIIKTWQSERKREEQSLMLKLKYLENPEYRKKISKAGKRRYLDFAEREKTRLKSLEYFRDHPEAKKRHSESIKGRISLYNIKTKLHIRVKPKDIELFSNEDWQRGTPLYNLVSRGKTSGKLTIIYVCPWKIENYLKPSKKFPNKKPKWHLEKPIQ